MKIAILGIGTVGSGVLKLLVENKLLLEERTGQDIEVTHLFGRTIHNIHDVDISGMTVVSDIEEIYESGVDLVVETLGGVDFCYDIHQNLFKRGISVVSANKDMLAQHVDDLSQLAQDHGAQLAYEAAVAGGIPIIQTLRHSLRGEQILGIQGILNGTSNYILTKMTQEGSSFDQALKEAQEAGYAEADPTSDVEGYDAQHKLAILSRLAYGLKIDEKDINVQGIGQVTPTDIQAAKDQGAVIKLVANSQYHGEDQVSLNLAPTFVPVQHPLAAINQATNSVVVEGQAVGQVSLTGPGAGSLETASAIVSDVVAICRQSSADNPIYDQPAKVVPAPASAHYIRYEDGTTEYTEKLSSSQLETYLADRDVAVCFQILEA